MPTDIESQAERVIDICLYRVVPIDQVQLSLKLTGEEAFLYRFLQKEGYKNTQQMLKKAIRLLAGHVALESKYPIMIQPPALDLTEPTSALKVFDAGLDERDSVKGRRRSHK